MTRDSKGPGQAGPCHVLNPISLVAWPTYNKNNLYYRVRDHGNYKFSFLIYYKYPLQYSQFHTAIHSPVYSTFLISIFLY